jgi:hypothetical protein
VQTQGKGSVLIACENPQANSGPNTQSVKVFKEPAVAFVHALYPERETRDGFP